MTPEEKAHLKSLEFYIQHYNDMADHYQKRMNECLRAKNEILGSPDYNFLKEKKWNEEHAARQETKALKEMMVLELIEAGHIVPDTVIHFSGTRDGGPRHFIGANTNRGEIRAEIRRKDHTAIYDYQFKNVTKVNGIQLRKFYKEKMNVGS